MSDEESISFDRTTVAQVSSSSIRSFAFSSVHHLSTQKRINGVGHFLLVYIWCQTDCQRSLSFLKQKQTGSFVRVRLEWKWQKLRAINGQIRSRSRQFKEACCPAEKGTTSLQDKEEINKQVGNQMEQNGNSCYYVRTNKTRTAEKKKSIQNK